MPMLIFLQQYQEVILTLLKKLFKKNFFFYPSGEPTLLGGVGWLLRYRALAVDDHSCMSCASHLQQARFVNNPD